LIAAIKDGKYTIDAKIAKRIDAETDNVENIYFGSPLDGIVFTDFRSLTTKGYAAAATAQAKELTKVKDAIYVLPAA